MNTTRTESDALGQREIASNALHGIHTERALENFPFGFSKIHPSLIHAYGAVKLACAVTNYKLGFLAETKFHPIESACKEMMNGLLDLHFPVDVLQGGAGTSTHMNVNEVLANRALMLMGCRPGDYSVIDPVEDINLHQSTNDTYPTALKIAAINELRALEIEITGLLEAFQNKEKEFAHIVKVGRTEYQDAVLTTLGREMSAYADALARDRWRVYKCEERLRVVNLGGTAIGTGLAAPRQYIFDVITELRNITGLGLSRAENLVDSTQNMDPFVEVSGIIKACSSTLFKICSDIRFMSSGPDAGIAEIVLPERQAGSSIMPGKINPVIPESVSQVALLVMAYDQTLTHACALGHLELNPFLPLVAHCLLNQLTLLKTSCRTLSVHCISGIKANEQSCRAHVNNSTATLTAFIEKIGYHQAGKIARTARAQSTTIRDALLDSGLIDEKEYLERTSPEHVLRLGSQLKSNDSKETSDENA